MTDEVSFEIYFRKIGEIKFPNDHSEFFWRKVPKYIDRNMASLLVLLFSYLYLYSIVLTVSDTDYHF